MTILLKKRVQFLLFIIGIIALSITDRLNGMNLDPMLNQSKNLYGPHKHRSEKFRLLVGEEAASKSGQFTFLNCFDGSSGTLACAVKEGVKLYFYNIRSLHVETKRNKAIETALADAVAQGMTAKDAAKVAQKEGAKAAKLATRKAKRIIGPIISSGWDFFEAIYFEGTVTEGFLRGTGTLIGTYYVGFIAEQRFGRFGYLVGSHLGSWVGGRIGLMVYDVVNGMHYMMHPQTLVYEDGDTVSKDFQPDYLEKSDQMAHNSYTDESTLSSNSDETNNYETAADDNFESTWSSSSYVSSNYETLADESLNAHKEL